MSVRRLLVLFLLVGGMLVLPLPAGAEPRTERELVRVTNGDRIAHGLRPMAVSPTLSRLARSHSQAMARRSGGRCTRGALWHNDISRQAGRWVWLGQNVGCGSRGRARSVWASVGRIQRAFMTSRGHKRNIMHRGATHFGVGTVVAGGVIWVTVNFKRMPPG
jgi:uncharacterized protein YkwD